MPGRKVAAEEEAQQPTGSAAKRRETSPSNRHGPKSEGQAAKRSRVSRACDQCRASRERCDGTQPTCETCSSQKRACSYHEQPKKRGIQPNYIRTLELTLAWLFRTFPDCEPTLTSSLPITESNAHVLIGGKNPTTSESLHQAWRNSLVCRQIDQLLSGAHIEIGRPFRSSEQPLPSTGTSDSEIPYHSPPLSAPLDGQGSHIERFGRPASEQQFPTEDLLTEQRGPYTASKPLAHILKLPGNAWTLLEYYFAFTHTWLPLGEKQSALKTMYAYPADGIPAVDATPGEHAELWSMLALSAAQMPHSNGSGSADFLRETARELIPSERGSFELGHVRALIILCLTEMVSREWQAALLLIGAVIRLLWLLGAVKTPSNATAEKASKRISLAAFVVENALAAQVHAPAVTQLQHIRDLSDLDEDGLEEWAPWSDPLAISELAGLKEPARSFSTFNKLLHTARDAHTTRMSQGQPESNQSLAKAIMSLLDNACRVDKRLQPAVVLINLRKEESIMNDRPLTALQDTPASLDIHNIFGTDLGKQHSSSQSWPNQEVYNQPQHSYFSIPNEVNDYTMEGSPMLTRQLTEPFSSGATFNAASQHLSGARPGAGANEGSIGENDIFEEFAMLGPAAPAEQHPQFMQNLGFGPDLDLAEFFGPDYQPSDPLLAYMQPSSYGMSLTEAVPGADAG